MRGTNGIDGVAVVSAIGSPPLARDKFGTRELSEEVFRIPPACAGQIGFIQTKSKKYRDHPRLRGTNFPEHCPHKTN